MIYDRHKYTVASGKRTLISHFDDRDMKRST